MYPTPSSQGIGHGAAQVFDTRNVVNAFIRISAMEQQQRMQDEQMMARMMAQFDPSKVRTADQARFAQMYNQLQETYIKNKDLYRNPLRNIEAYRQATGLMNEMKAMTARSRQMEETLLMSAREQKRGNGYTPQSVQKMQMYNGMSTDDIIAHNGGRMLSPADFDYIPDDINETELRTVVHSIGRDYAESAFEVKTSKDDPNIPEHLERRITRTKIKDDAIPGIAQMMLGRDKWARRLNYEWSEMDVTQQGEVRKLASSIPGIDMRNGPQMLAAMLAKGYAVIDVDEKIDVNPEWAENQRIERERRQAEEFDRRQSIRDAASDRRMIGMMYGPAANIAVTQAGELMGALASGDPAKIQAATSPLMGAASRMEGGRPYVFYPRSYSSAEAMWKNLEPYTRGGGGYSNDPFFNITKEDVERAYRDNRAIMALRFTGEDVIENPSTGAKEKVKAVSTYLVDPSKPGADQALAGLLTGYLPGSSVDKGLFPGNPFYTNKQVRVPNIVASKR